MRKGVKRRLYIYWLDRPKRKIRLPMINIRRLKCYTNAHLKRPLFAFYTFEELKYPRFTILIRH